MRIRMSWWHVPLWTKSGLAYCLLWKQITQVPGFLSHGAHALCCVMNSPFRVIQDSAVYRWHPRNSDRLTCSLLGAVKSDLRAGALSSLTPPDRCWVEALGADILALSLISEGECHFLPTTSDISWRFFIDALYLVEEFLFCANLAGSVSFRN